jgi:hypothetical protein
MKSFNSIIRFLSELRFIWFVFLILPFHLTSYDIELIEKEGAAYTFYISDLQKLRSCFGLQSFVEAGTAGLAASARRAATIFSNVQTIEISPRVYEEAKCFLKSFPNVHIYLGDAVQNFHFLIENSLPRRVYWLDAHSSGGGTGGIPGISPVIPILSAIRDFGAEDDVIMIDDLQGEYYDNVGYQPLREIYNELHKMSEKYVFWNIGDIAIAYSQKCFPNISVSPIVKACTCSRLFDPFSEDLNSLKELFKQESVFVNADRFSNEMKIIRKLQQFVEIENLVGGKIIYYLWETLSISGTQDHSTAAARFRKLYASPFSHWRFRVYEVKSLILNDEMDLAREIFERDLRLQFNSYRECFEYVFGKKSLNILLNTVEEI